jgi:hypothetical protein
MNNQQLYLAIGLPTLVVLASVTVSLVQLFDIRNDLRAIHKELIDIRRQIADLELALRKEIADLRIEITRDFVRKQ